MSKAMDFVQRIEAARESCGQLLAHSDNVPIPYPWTSLEQAIMVAGRPLLLVGYGSLLNPASAKRTVANTPSVGHPPVIAFGARRVFNYVMPQSVLDRYGDQISPRERAALNAAWTGKSESVLTGRVLDVPVSDLPALRERERGYHLCPVAFVPWGDPSSPPSLGHVLVADERPVAGVRHVDNSLLPHPGYTSLCREGARLVDAEFERAFLATSWIAPIGSTLEQYLAMSKQT